MPKKDSHLEELQRAYAAQLKRKDAEIDDLRKRNDILVKTALRQSQRITELEEACSKLAKKLDSERKNT